MKKKKLLSKLERLYMENARMLHDIKILCTSEKFTDVFTVLQQYRLKFEVDDLVKLGSKSEEKNNGIWAIIKNEIENGNLNPKEDLKN